MCGEQSSDGAVRAAVYKPETETLHCLKYALLDQTK